MAAQIQIANLAEFLESVRLARERVSDLSAPLSKIGRDWMRTNKLLFNQSPGRFADLNSSGSKGKVRGFGDKKTGEKGGQVGGYKLQKLRRWGFVYPILSASGALERSMTEPGDPNSLFDILNQSTLMLGTRVVSKSGANYPYFLNQGTRFMPARRFLEIPQLSVARWMNILRDYVIESFGAPGKKPDPKPKADSVSTAGPAGASSSAAPASSGGSSRAGGGGGGGGSSSKRRKTK